MSVKRIRWFCLVSYLPFILVSEILQNKISQIDGYAFIEHNKDVDTKDGVIVNIPAHCHIVLHTFNAKTFNQIKLWFNGWQDDDGKDINTFVQELDNLSAYRDYLTHKNCDNKYHYKESDIIEYNLFKYIKAESESTDNCFNILIDFNANIPLSVMVKKYGRDFIINYDRYYQMFLRIKESESSLDVYK